MSKRNAKLNQDAPDPNDFGIVHLQSPGGRAATGRAPFDFTIRRPRPLEMFLPHLLPRIVQRHRLLCFRIERGIRSPFVRVATWTRHRKIRERGYSAAAARSDVVNRKPGDLPFDWQHTVFATTIGAGDDLATESIGNVGHGFTNSGSTVPRRWRASRASSRSRLRRSLNSTSETSSACSSVSSNSLRSPSRCMRRCRLKSNGWTSHRFRHLRWGWETAESVYHCRPRAGRNR